MRLALTPAGYRKVSLAGKREPASIGNEAITAFRERLQVEWCTEDLESRRLLSPSPLQASCSVTTSGE